MFPKATQIRLDPETRSELESWLRASTTEQRMTRRARIILLAAEGKGSRAIAREIGVRPRVVSTWRLRFAARGIEGLKDKPRPGAKLVYTEATDKRILAMLDQPIPKGRARWTCELIAKALGDVDVNYVRRFLRKQKIDLAGRKSWCESNDPDFTAKAADIVGLYMAPPKNAVVVCVDEKPSIQALERAQGYLKLPNGRAVTGESPQLQAARHHDAICGTRGGDRQGSQGYSQEAPPADRVPRVYERACGSLPRQRAPCHSRQSQHPQAQGRPLA